MGAALEVIDIVHELDLHQLLGKLNGAGNLFGIKMIDNLPAFPDEIPEPGWTDLRFGTPAGMVTLRRTTTGYQLVIWGNADTPLQGDQRSIADEIVALTGGKLG
jgi:hypothetical protein